MLAKALEESRAQAHALVRERDETAHALASLLESMAGSCGSGPGASSPLPGEEVLLPPGSARGLGPGSGSQELLEGLRRRVGRLREQLQCAEVDIAGG